MKFIESLLGWFMQSKTTITKSKIKNADFDAKFQNEFPGTLKYPESFILNINLNVKVINKFKNDSSGRILLTWNFGILKEPPE